MDGLKKVLLVCGGSTTDTNAVVTASVLFSKTAPITSGLDHVAAGGSVVAAACMDD